MSNQIVYRVCYEENGLTYYLQGLVDDTSYWSTSWSNTVEYTRPQDAQDALNDAKHATPQKPGRVFSVRPFDYQST